MSTNDSASRVDPNATLYVSTIDISLARDSKKKIESFQLKKNDEPLGDTVQLNIGAGEERREIFKNSVELTHNDCITVLVNCNCQRRTRKQVNLDFRLRDIDCMRMEDDRRSYRKKDRNVVVVLNGQHSIFGSLLATTTSVLNACPRFRLLVIGNSGVGKSSLIHKVFGVDNVHTSENTRGIANISQEFKSPKNDRFVVHDSLGFESGDGENIEIVRKFVAERQAKSRLEDRLHAIWLCLEIPYAGGRLLEAGVERFLQRRDEILGKIPLVVVLTKLDLLVAQLYINPPADQDLEQYKLNYLTKHCIQPLHKAAGSSVAHVTVSVQDGYSESLTDLVKATLENMDDYHANEAPRVVASIAQRVSIKEKIELSILVGKKKYWRMLLKSSVFRGHTFEECLKVIRNDVVTVWNFVDPDNCLMDDKIIKYLLLPDNPDANGGSSSAATMTSFAGLLASAAELFKGLSGSGEPTTAIIAPVAGVVVTLLQMTYEAYQEAKKDVKILMAFIVDLICVMQIIYLLTSGGVSRVSLDTTNRALRVYKDKAQKFVHMCISAFDGKKGILVGSRDHVLDQVEALVWRYSVTDREFEDLKKRMNEETPSSSL